MHRSPSIPLWALGLIIAFFVVVAGAVASLRGDRNSTTAEQELRKWADKLGIDVKSASCNSQDSDHDSYVSCSFVDGAGVRQQVECAAAFTLQHGCRDPKPHVPPADDRHGHR